MTEVWAKAKTPGKTTHGRFHHWQGGVSTCPQARDGAGPSRRAQRSKQPWNACRECVRILNGQPFGINQRHGASTA